MVDGVCDYSALTRRKLHRNDLNSGIHQDLSTIVVGGYVTSIFQVTANELKEEFGGRINELTQTVNDMRAENQTLSQNMQTMSSQHQEAMQSIRTENQALSQNMQTMSSQHQEAMQSMHNENRELNQKMDAILQRLITNSQNQQPPGNGLNQQPSGNTQYANQYPGFFGDGVPNTPPPYEDIQQSNNSQTPNSCSFS